MFRYESSAPPVMVAAVGWFGRDTRVRSGGDAALLDGGVARLAGAWHDAGRNNPHVHDPSGVLRLWSAWNILVGTGLGCHSLSAACETQWRLIPGGCARVLGH